jgi:hypothetical protein
VFLAVGKDCNRYKGLPQAEKTPTNLFYIVGGEENLRTLNASIKRRQQMWSNTFVHLRKMLIWRKTTSFSVGASS